MEPRRCCKVDWRQELRCETGLRASGMRRSQSFRHAPAALSDLPADPTAHSHSSQRGTRAQNERALRAESRSRESSGFRRGKDQLYPGVGKLVVNMSAAVSQETDNLFLDAHSGRSPCRMAGKPPLLPPIEDSSPARSSVNGDGVRLYCPSRVLTDC